MITCVDCGLEKSEHEIALFGSPGKGQCVPCQLAERHDEGHHRRRPNPNCSLCKTNQTPKKLSNKEGAQMVLDAIDKGEKNFPGR